MAGSLSVAELLGTPSRSALVADAMQRARMQLVPGQAEERIDPLLRLFDPAFTDKTWTYEHSKVGEIAGKLHPKQLEQLHSEAMHRWAFWGNQAGKTMFAAVDFAMKALGRHPLQKLGLVRMPPWTGWAPALTWELWEKILLPELLTWLPPWRVLDAPPAFRQSTKRDIIVLADNGRQSRITGKAAEQGPDRYQAARLDDAWLDEEHPEGVWDELQPRMLRLGGRTLGTMTPLKGFTWVHGRVYEPFRTGRIEKGRHFVTHAGTADNPSISAAAITELTTELKHNPAQLAARLHGLFVRPEGAVLPWDPEKHLRDVTSDVLNDMQHRGAWYGSLDLGKWRFALPFGVADVNGVFTLIDEYFSQNEDVDVRAKGIDAVLKSWGVPDTIMIPADCADPKGIADLNDALERIGSKYSVFPVEGNLKAKTAGIARVENMLNRGAFFVRRGMGAGRVWRLGMDASKPGKPVEGSRWMWEAANWQYPKMADGKVQKDEPDDASADGADMMDATRYLAMTYFAANEPAEPKKGMTVLQRLHKEMEELDELDEQASKTANKYGSVLRQ